MGIPAIVPIVKTLAEWKAYYLANKSSMNAFEQFVWAEQPDTLINALPEATNKSVPVQSGNTWTMTFKYDGGRCFDIVGDEKPGPIFSIKSITQTSC